ncbi:MAG TPA: Fic family protein [Candidatus Eisenbacteria bacterium]|nr:Fic family protein [Candidatus Eisenbacteria bacterium]
MKRERTGRYEEITVGGETVRALIPSTLPPEPPLDLRGGLQRILEESVLSLGRLDSLSAIIPDSRLLLYSYVRKEAVLSSQIEGTQSSLSDLLLFELGEAPGVPMEDVTEVSNYVAAMEHGLARLREGFPLSHRLLREVHGVLLSRGRGSGKSPGEFRRSQNWIGGTRPGTAVFVPPPPAEIAEAMADLERFLHADSDGWPIILRAAVAHVQFETIHPFLDGNGRVGRLLITLLLCEAGVLSEPLLYVSLYLKRNRQEYYRLLDDVRRDGDWESWIEFFLLGIRETAENAVATARELMDLVRGDEARLQAAGRWAGSALRVLGVLSERPLVTLKEVRRRTGLSAPAVGDAMSRLVEIGIAQEVTGKRRNRAFAYEAYLAALSRESSVG